MGAPSGPRIEVYQTYIVEGHVCANVFYYIPVGGSAGLTATQLNAIEVGEAADIRFTNVYKAALATEVTLYRPRVVLDDGLDSYEYVVPGTTPGEDEGDILPAQNTCVLVWHVEPGPFQPTRKVRGRTYVSGCAETHFNGSLLEDSILPALNAIGAVHYTTQFTIQGSSYQPAIWSQAKNIWGVVTGHHVTPAVRTLRRRRTSS